MRHLTAHGRDAGDEPRRSVALARLHADATSGRARSCAPCRPPSSSRPGSRRRSPIEVAARARARRIRRATWSPRCRRCRPMRASCSSATSPACPAIGALLVGADFARARQGGSRADLRRRAALAVRVGRRSAELLESPSARRCRARARRRGSPNASTRSTIVITDAVAQEPPEADLAARPRALHHDDVRDAAEQRQVAGERRRDGEHDVAPRRLRHVRDPARRRRARAARSTRCCDASTTNSDEQHVAGESPRAITGAAARTRDRARRRARRPRRRRTAAEEREHPRDRSIVTYSESANPSSKFSADQTRMYSQKKWNDPPFCEGQERAAKSVKVIAIRLLCSSTTSFQLVFSSREPPTRGR